MYAVIETGGKQYKVEAGQELFIEKLNVNKIFLTEEGIKADLDIKGKMTVKMQ